MITIQDLDFFYKKKSPLFNKLSLELPPGSITGLLGKNGAGKTTLLKLMAGLCHPHHGKVTVMAHNPRKREPSFLGQVFFVPEEFYFPSLSLKNFIQANSGFYPSFDAELMDRLLKAFDLNITGAIDKMSYGQKKKFLISFALATRCRLLVMDEPTNGLDIPSKSVFRKIMASSLNDDQLVIISTHQVKDVENLIDRLVILDNGRIVMQKDVYEISSQLVFEHRTTAGGDDVLYSEPVPGGYRVITPRVDVSSLIDIELLFNAVTQGKPLFSHSQTLTPPMMAAGE
jgi:ABC-2 type transport system ATP-binding protein